MSSIIYNGHEIQDLIVNGNQAQLWLNGQKLYPTEEPVDPYNPLGLPPFTIRCKFSSGYTPSIVGTYKTLVDATENVWDITKTSKPKDWSSLLRQDNNLLEIVGANTSGVNTLSRLCQQCSSLTSVALFDTRDVLSFQNAFTSCTALESFPTLPTGAATNFLSMIGGCTSLKSIPLFDTSSCKTADYMCYGCSSVESGALALYQQMSNQATQPTSYDNCFTDCGSNTVTGAAELAQIPASWGGTGA